MNKSELLEKIREKNEELDSFNKELIEITVEENAKNLGRCFKQDLGYTIVYYRIMQIYSKQGRYKILIVSDSELSIRWYSSLENLEAEPCSIEEFDKVYDEVINNTLANKVIK